MSVSTFDDKHVTILTIVTVPAGKMMEVLTILSELHTIAAEGTTECIHYGWAVSGDQVLCRHGYIGGGYLQHVADVQSKMETAIPLVGGPGAFKTYAVGPSEELEKLKPALERSVSYNFVDGAFILNDYLGLSGESESVKKLASEHGAEAATMDKHISMFTTVTVDDEALEKLMAIFPKLQNTTKNGTKDCVYYNIATVTKGPNSHEVMIMDAYTTVEDTMQHMVDVAEHAQAMMACLPDGLVDEFHVIGTSAQVEKLKAVLPPFARPGGNFWWTLQDVAFLPILRNKLG